jgi:hypothetical protein
METLKMVDTWVSVNSAGSGAFAVLAVLLFIATSLRMERPELVWISQGPVPFAGSQPIIVGAGRRVIEGQRLEGIACEPFLLT